MAGQLAGSGASALAFAESLNTVDDDRAVTLGALHAALFAAGQVMNDLADPIRFYNISSRFRKFLSSGRALLLVVGSSFSDEHLNQIIFDALRQIVGSWLRFFSLQNQALLDRARDHQNFPVYTPRNACIGGILGSPVGAFIACRRKGLSQSQWGVLTVGTQPPIESSDGGIAAHARHRCHI